MTIRDFQSAGEEGEHAEIDSLVDRINRLTPMARSKVVKKRKRSDRFGRKPGMKNSLRDVAIFRAARTKENNHSGQKGFMRR